MFNKMKNEGMLLVCSLSVFIISVCFINFLERQNCMNVPIISEEQLNEYTETTSLDISLMSFEGEKIAADFPGNSIYISQSSGNLKHFYMLQGKLEPTTPEYSLYFLDTPALNDISESVQENEPLTLIIRCGDTYQKVNVVITTLPVLYLDFDGSCEDEQGRTLNNGKFTLWNNLNSSNSYKTVTSLAEWRMRGNSTTIYPKLSWKLNLRTDNGENNDLDLLNLGSDDDWILNPMSMDDTNLKERMSQELWNQLASKTDHNYQMSKGEYVEVLINGAYQGLYMLQRRVDAKYLNLDQEEDILMKGINTWEAETVSDGYEIVSTPFGDEETYIYLEKTLDFQNGNRINTDNFIDVNLLLQFLSGADNYGYKNMFYALVKTNETYEMYLVPWDTDLSLGVTWGYDYEESLNEIVERQELGNVREHVSDIDEQITKRWQELRKSIYSEKKIFSIFDSITAELTVSGVIERDQKRWGLLHEEEDTWENLQLFIKDRLMFLDEYYMQ